MICGRAWLYGTSCEPFTKSTIRIGCDCIGTEVDLMVPRTFDIYTCCSKILPATFGCSAHKAFVIDVIQLTYWFFSIESFLFSLYYMPTMSMDILRAILHISNLINSDQICPPDVFYSLSLHRPRHLPMVYLGYICFTSAYNNNTKFNFSIPK